MQMPCKVGMLGKLSNLSRPYGKLKIALLPPVLSRFPTHPRAGANGMRSKRNPLILITRKQEALRKAFLCHLNKCPRKDDKSIGCFHTIPQNIIMETNDNPMLRRLKPIDTPAKFRNKNKYCKYNEDHGHTTFECHELKKALHELADQRQLNHFLKRGEGRDHNHCNPDERKTMILIIIAAIIGGIDGKELSTGYQKSQIRKINQVMATGELKPLVGPTMTFGPENMRPLQTPHNDALVIQLKIATAMVHRVLVTREVRLIPSLWSA
ncbi:hypothetical protein Cgig2_003166 [Carnegiea gigantea]|uniref:Reverse transcriptase domain-containing protein n=1 Tax=Carnegiea gigantea TaxID=171969 RepID=A0A9Q1K3B5_9CARY|nr:hypothetical protein Cgig2_003166 [Carnegiea gigantea]